VKLARIVCDNSDEIESAQVYVMVLPDPEMSVFLKLILIRFWKFQIIVAYFHVQQSTSELQELRPATPRLDQMARRCRLFPSSS